MSERRQQPRNRIYYGGKVAFNARNSTIDCVVRNFNMFGAKVEFEGTTLVPDEVDFEIERKGISCLARMAWRDRHTAGLVFANVHETSAVIPLGWALRLRASERANRQMQSRLAQLRSEY